VVTSPLADWGERTPARSTAPSPAGERQRELSARDALLEAVCTRRTALELERAVGFEDTVKATC
jgi:hypothetical protein